MCQLNEECTVCYVVTNGLRGLCGPLQFVFFTHFSDQGNRDSAIETQTVVNWLLNNVVASRFSA